MMSRETPTGDELLHALVSHYADRTEWSVCSAADLLIHAAQIVRGVSEDEATEYVGEEIAERRTSRG